MAHRLPTVIVLSLSLAMETLVLGKLSEYNILGISFHLVATFQKVLF